MKKSRFTEKQIVCILLDAEKPVRLRERSDSMEFRNNLFADGRVGLVRWRWRMCENFGNYDKRMAAARKSWPNETWQLR